MLKNYFKTALSSWLNQKLFAAINLLGLAIGLTCFSLIFLFVRHQLSFDNYHPNAERIFRLNMEFDDGQNIIATNHYSLVPLLKENYPQIAAAGRLLVRSETVARGPDAYREDGFVLIDPEIFTLFSFDWLQGNPQQALRNPFSLVMTQSSATKYFGSENPVGQTMLVNNETPMTVTGVIRDLPNNTHLYGDIFTSIATGVALYSEANLNRSFEFHSYIKLAEFVDIQKLENEFSTSLLSLLRADFQGRTKAVPVALPDIHFNPVNFELPGKPGSMTLVLAFTAIAVGILLIACCNFMNLYTARSSQRAIEVGLRKTVGAPRRQLIGQFLGESIFLSFFALLLAIVLTELVLPVFNGVLGYQIEFNFLQDPINLYGSIALVLIIGFLAGSYPAFYLSAFEPSKVLKGDSHKGSKGLVFRNLLVIFQFSISIAMIIATVVIYAQMYFTNNLDLGFSRERVVVLKGSATDYLGSQWQTMKRELLSNPEITHVSGSASVPGLDFLAPPYSLRYEGGDKAINNMPFLSVDFDFFDTYGIKLLAGRTFNPDLATDRMRFSKEDSGSAYILNVQAARQLGWEPTEAIGNWLEWGEVVGPRGPVIGVVDDVYFSSLRLPQIPMMFFVGRSQFGDSVFSFNYASIKITGNRIDETLAFIDSVWGRFMPGEPVSRSFLNQNLELMYQQENQQGKLVLYFSLLAIFIACMGLYGLAALNAERRTKEIGVRKVMGGSVWSIVLLLTNQFSKLVLVSNLIAWPAAYFAVNRWLENFAYRIDLTPLIFIGSGLIALCIAWVTVGGTTAKAASQKPVLALRYE